MRKWLLVCIGLSVLLAGWRPAPKEPEGLALVRVLGVDGSNPVTLTAVCGGEDQGDQSRGRCAGGSFARALECLPWSGEKELSLTSVSYLIVGRDVDLEQVLLGALRNEELGAACTVWLAENGAAGFTDDGIPLLDAELVKRAYEEAARLGKPLSFHEENPAFIQNNGINGGKAAKHYGIGGSDRQAEIWMVERDLALAEGTEAEISIQHISTKEAVELVRKAKKTNPHIHAEATPHHFTLTEEASVRYGTLAKMNPPLREEADRMAIIEGLRDGTIDMIATDHAPHSKEEKEKPITEAPSGIIGLETALSLGIRELVDKGYLTMMELVSRMSWQPAQFYHLDAGYLAEGGPADLVVFDSSEKWKAEGFLSKSCNSPFLGEELPGTVYYTVCGGKVVYRKM